MRAGHAEQHQRLLIAWILLGRDKVNCTAEDLSSPTSFLPSAMHPDKSVVEIQFRSHDPNTDITDSSGELGLLSAAHGEPPGLLGHSDSVSMSAGSGLST